MAERLQVRWDKLLDMREITPEQLLDRTLRGPVRAARRQKLQLQRCGDERSTKWLDSEEKLTRIETWGLDATTFVKALKRLKALKNIPGVLTSEVLRSLHPELRAQLSTDLRRRPHELDMVKALRERTARTGRVHSECLMKNLAERGHSFTTSADPEVGVQTGPGIEVNRNVRVSARVRTHDEHRDGSRDGVTHTQCSSQRFVLVSHPPSIGPCRPRSLRVSGYGPPLRDGPLWPLPGDSVADEGCPLPHAILRVVVTGRDHPEYLVQILPSLVDLAGHDHSECLLKNLP